MTTYSVTIRLDAASIAALQGHQLQVFKGVKACDPDQGVSTVWATVDRFYHLIHLSWRSECHGFFTSVPCMMTMPLCLRGQSLCNRASS